MRVLASIQQRSFARYIAFDLAEAARRLGWEVLWVDFDGHAQRLRGRPADEWRQRLEEVATEIRAFKADLQFSYGLEAFGRVFLSDLPDSHWVLAEIAAVPIACFFFDFGPPFTTPVDDTTVRYVERLQQADVRIFCWDRAALADLHRYGVAAEFLPMAVNERMFFPPDEERPRDLPIVFSGGPTAERIAALRPLAPLGLSIVGYGDGWQGDPVLRAHYRGVVAERPAMRDLYQRARVAVNVTRAHGRDSLNMRVFEAMACGAAVVTDQALAAAQLFTPGIDLLTVEPGEDFAPTVAQVLADERARARLARRGAAVVRDAHTYLHRLSSIVPTLRGFVTESRAWPHWERFVTADAAKALRFVTHLRGQQQLQREDLWHLADGMAHLRLGDVARARQSLAAARRRNPALRQLPALEAQLR